MSPEEDGSQARLPDFDIGTLSYEKALCPIIPTRTGFEEAQGLLGRVAAGAIERDVV